MAFMPLIQNLNIAHQIVAKAKAKTLRRTRARVRRVMVKAKVKTKAKKAKMPPLPHHDPPLHLPPSLPHQHGAKDTSSSFLYLPPGPTCHCGRSRLTFYFSSHHTNSLPSHPLRPGLPLWLVPPNSLLPSLPTLQARLVIVAGSAVFLLLPLLRFSTFLSAPRPGLSLWQVPPFPAPLIYPLGLSCLISSLPTSYLLHGRSKVILLTLCQDRSTSDLIGNMFVEDYKFLSLESLAVLHSPDHELNWLDIAWLYFTLASH